MIVALTASDIWTTLLVVGIIASFVTVVMIVGSASAKRQASVASVVAELPPGSLARTIRDTASAKAAEAAQRRTAHTLTNVHVILPTGQTPTVANDLRHGSDVTKEASEILVHFAEHDPKRIAEVITQWIQVDENRARKLQR